MPQDWKEILGRQFGVEMPSAAENEEPEVQPEKPRKQRLVVTIDRRRRAGKQVTLITGFVGGDDALEALGRELKTRLGTGGSAKDGEILIQGDVRDKVVAILTEMGHQAKRGN